MDSSLVVFSRLWFSAYLTSPPYPLLSLPLPHPHSVSFCNLMYLHIPYTFLSLFTLQKWNIKYSSLQVIFLIQHILEYPQVPRQFT